MSTSEASGPRSKFAKILYKLSKPSRQLALGAVICVVASTIVGVQASSASERSTKCFQNIESFDGIAQEWEASPGILRQHVALLSSYLHLALETRNQDLKREYVILAIAHANLFASFGVGDNGVQQAIDEPKIGEAIDDRYMLSLSKKLEKIGEVWNAEFKKSNLLKDKEFRELTKDCPDITGTYYGLSAVTLLLNIFAILMIGAKEIWFDE